MLTLACCGDPVMIIWIQEVIGFMIIFCNTQSCIGKIRLVSTLINSVLFMKTNFYFLGTFQIHTRGLVAVHVYCCHFSIYILTCYILNICVQPMGSTGHKWVFPVLHHSAPNLNLLSICLIGGQQPHPEPHKLPEPFPSHSDEVVEFLYIATYGYWWDYFTIEKTNQFVIIMLLPKKEAIISDSIQISKSGL